MNHLTDFQLNEYLDNAVDETTQHTIELHIQTCEDCSTRLVELKNLFTSIESLPEVKLRSDLSPSILARLPQKRSRLLMPALAAQLGVVLGMFFWFSMQVTNFITPVLSKIEGFNFPKFAMLSLQIVIPSFQFPNLYSIFSIFISLFSIPKFQLPTFDFPTFKLSTLNLSPFNFAFIATSVFLLWLVGNLSLLRDRSGVQK